MTQILISVAKACLGESYPRLRAWAVRWSDIWTNRIKNARLRLSYVKRLPLDRAQLEPVKRKNRETCRSVSRWYDSELLARSVCNYGISLDKLHLLDGEVGAETTLSDIVTYHCSKLPAPARYLEIGVSVGKNFTQVLGAVSEGDFTGFDIEDVNPIITRDLKHLTHEEWSALNPAEARQISRAEFSRSLPSSLDVFEDGSGKKKVRYVAGNVFDERCWRVLARRKYDLIFSDALHTGPAIKHEYSMMKKYDLFGSDGFTIIWDDLHFPGMREAFLDITDDLCTTFGEDGCARSLHLVHGWMGKKLGYRHLIGIFNRRP